MDIQSLGNVPTKADGKPMFYVFLSVYCLAGLQLRRDMVVETKATLKVVRTRVEYVLIYS